VGFLSPFPSFSPPHLCWICPPACTVCSFSFRPICAHGPAFADSSSVLTALCSPASRDLCFFPPSSHSVSAPPRTGLNFLSVLIQSQIQPPLFPSPPRCLPGTTLQLPWYRSPDPAERKFVSPVTFSLRSPLAIRCLFAAPSYSYPFSNRTSPLFLLLKRVSPRRFDSPATSSSI